MTQSTACITNSYGTILTVLLKYLLSLTYLNRLTMTYTYLQYVLTTLQTYTWNTFLLKLTIAYTYLQYSIMILLSSIFLKKRYTKQYTIQL